MRFCVLLAALLAAAPAWAGDPPTEGRLYQFAKSKQVTAFVDWASLHKQDGEIQGWSFQVYVPPWKPEGLDASLGSAWEAFGVGCDQKYFVTYRFVGLTKAHEVATDEQPDEDEEAARQDIKPNTFSEVLAKLVCAGKEPHSDLPYQSGEDAETGVLDGQ